jgi:hypothetical protein
MLEANINRIQLLENSHSLFSSLRIFSILVICAMSLSGCQYYADPVRQQNLCKDLSRHYTFQQTPATSLAPSQYHLCGDNCYPCRAYTEWGVPPQYIYKSSHHHVKHKALKRSLPKTKMQKNVQTSKASTNTKDNILNGNIFLSLVKPSDSSTMSKSVRNPV